VRTPRSLRRRLGPIVIVAVTGLLALGTLPAAGETQRSTLTAEARRAGVQEGNAQMGWRQRGLDQQRVRGGESDATARAFTPSGVLGIDVASYQRNVNWKSWASKGRKFAYVKATEGSTYRNPYFTSQYSGAAKAGLIRGAYHFANPAGKSGKTQAQYFVKNGGGWSPDGKTLPGVLDIEYNPYGSTCYGVSKTKMVKWINDFVVEYKKLTTRDAVIYTTLDWWNHCTGNTTKFSQTNPLWAARYGTKTAGKLPAGWKTATFWQWTSSPLDQDRFSASYDRLVVLATKAS
jgi:GH25 family lysozyme M1 (1,4-beta-N-acetylmuramidase)